MTIYDLPGTDAMWEGRKSWSSPWSELAERVYITSGNDWFHDFKDIVQNHALEKESTMKLRETKWERFLA